MAGKPKASKSKRSSILFKMVSTANTGYYYLARRNPKQKSEKMLNPIFLFLHQVLTNLATCFLKSFPKVPLLPGAP